MGRSSQFSNQNIGNNQQTHNMHSTLGGGAPYNLYSNEGVPAARVIATTPLRDLMHHTGGGGAPGSPMGASGFRDGGNRLWNSGNPIYSSTGLPPQPSGLQPRPSSGYSTNSLGFSSRQRQQQQLNESGMTNSLGYTTSQVVSSQQPLRNTNPLSVGANTTTHFPGSIPSGLRNDDSLMIDSLFGVTSSTAQSSNVAATNSLLTGFNALSLPNEGDGVKSSGLWGSSDLTETWHENNGNGGNGAGAVAPNVSSISNIFSNEIPNHSQDRPQESRFNWNSTNANH